MDFDIEEKLRTLGVPECIETFRENEIDNEAVLLLGDDELKQLIPKIGPRAKFKDYIQSYKTQLQDVTFSIFDEDGIKLTSEDLNKEQPDKTDAPNNTNPNPGCINGRAILKEGKDSQGLLTEGSRRVLCQLIINQVIDGKPGSKISTEEFYKLASDIVEIFPKESIVVYYSAYLSGKGRTAKKNASGKLYESYITRRRKLRNTGVLAGTSRLSSTSSSSTLTNDSTLSDDIDINEDIIWLKNNVDPCETLMTKWDNTREHRLKN